MHNCRAEYAIEEIKRMGLAFEPKFRQLEAQERQLSGEVKFTQEAVLKVQQSLNQVKGTQEHQGLKAESVQNQLQRIEDNFAKMKTTLKGPPPNLG